MKKVAAKRNFFSLLMHFFNHQTHHRGQVTAMIQRLGFDYGDIDMLFIPH